MQKLVPHCNGLVILLESYRIILCGCCLYEIHILCAIIFVYNFVLRYAIVTNQVLLNLKQDYAIDSHDRLTIRSTT